MSELFSIVVFPFLKTSGPVSLGVAEFRPTEDTDHLSADASTALSEIREMLFTHDHWRITSATYAVVSRIAFDHEPPNTQHLEDIQSVIAYLYTSPHEIFGTPFLSSEHASVVVFTPARISKAYILGNYNAESVIELTLDPDERGNVRGYTYLYNFRHRHWALPQSRVYGPIPHPVLNISQDLEADIARAAERPTYRLLFRLLDKQSMPVSRRVFTALRWYNSAHRAGTDDLAALVHLAIAFEALLGLPQSEKTDRLVDAISLLLGRMPRLDAWANQFYGARSRIVHEGSVQDLRFVAAAETRSEEAQYYQSLLSYGTQVFRLCLGTLLVGSDLAEEAGLKDRLVTNQERFTALCKVLDDTQTPPTLRLKSASELVDTIDRYQFLQETGLRLETMIGSVRLACRTLLESQIPVEQPLAVALEATANMTGGSDTLSKLDLIHELDRLLPRDRPPDAGHEDLVRRLTKTVWGNVFMHYHWLKRQRDEQSTPASSSE